MEVVDIDYLGRLYKYNEALITLGSLVNGVMMASNWNISEGSIFPHVWLIFNSLSSSMYQK